MTSSRRPCDTGGAGGTLERLDAHELISRAEQELADDDERSARKTVERARRELLEQRDSKGLERLLDLAGRLDDGGDLTYAVRQNLRWLSRQPRLKPGRRLGGLLTVLLVHGFGALMWVAWLGFSSDIGTDRQLAAALAIGAATWLAAAVLIAWLWWSGRASFWVPFAWWMPSFLLVIAVVYGWNEPVGS